jgi:hypothetical protein
MFTALMVVLAGAIFGSMIGGPGIDQVGSTMDAWKKAAKASVEDDQKEDEALALLEKVKAEMPTHNAALADAVSKYLKIDANYSATAEDYEAAIVEVNNSWTQQETWLVDQRFALQALMTDSEWNKALSIVNEELKENWDTIKETQKKLRDMYLKKVKKVEKHD